MQFSYAHSWVCDLCLRPPATSFYETVWVNMESNITSILNNGCINHIYCYIFMFRKNWIWSKFIELMVLILKKFSRRGSLESSSGRRHPLVPRKFMFSSKLLWQWHSRFITAATVWVYNGINSLGLKNRNVSSVQVDKNNEFSLLPILIKIRKQIFFWTR